MLVIGLTGGIGSGKTAVSDIFKDFGIEIIDADLASRVVVKPGKPALQEIKELYGSEILTYKGALDRAKLREIIISDPKQKKRVESILHPYIGEQMNQEIMNVKSEYSIMVAPLLLETNTQQICSRVLVVDVPEELQIERTSSRDNVSDDHVKKIISIQINRKDRLEKADDVIVNDGSKAELYNKVEKLHKRYLQIAKENEEN